MICEKNVKNYCKDDITKIENYEKAINDKTQTWDCHHRLELHTDGTVRFTHEGMIRAEIYYNRPANELIFLKHSEHQRLHTKGKTSWIKGKQHNDETKRKISESNKGKTKGKKRKPFSAEHRQNLSVSMKGRTPWNKNNKDFNETIKNKVREMRDDYLQYKQTHPEIKWNNFQKIMKGGSNG